MGKWTQFSSVTKKLFTTDTCWPRKKISFLLWSVTMSISHTSEQALHPGVFGQDKPDSIISFNFLLILFVCVFVCGWGCTCMCLCALLCLVLVFFVLIGTCFFCFWPLCLLYGTLKDKEHEVVEGGEEGGRKGKRRSGRGEYNQNIVYMKILK